MSPIPIEMRLRAEQLIYELHGWSSTHPTTAYSDCMSEAAYLLSDMMKVLNAQPVKGLTPEAVLQEAKDMIAERGRRRDTHTNLRDACVTALHAVLPHRRQ